MAARTELAQIIARLSPSERGRLLANLKRYEKARRDTEWLMRRPSRWGVDR